MLGPVDAPQIHTLLVEDVGHRYYQANTSHLAEKLDVFDNLPDGVVHLLLSRESTEHNSDSRAHFKML
ncbi:unnamed protein product [Mesocestoides corti]|uniref:Transcriptional regulator n=1 Tax=Mesocestoides corti TaxID=53468 RepID=A0A0R3UI26_MESCO|nr:unnamed protein product [Mesocestoides corti]